VRPSDKIGSAPFLEETAGGALDFRTPPRRGNHVSPLIEAEEVYPALERLVLGARDRVHLAFWLFDPRTRLRSPEARGQNLDRWSDLLIATAERGVDVRLFVSDFEPVVGNYFHRICWRNIQALLEAMGQRESRPANLQILIARHLGEIGPAWRIGFWPFLRAKLWTLLHHARRSGDLETVPGLWPHCLPEGESWRARLWPPAALWPASHHQKMAVIDGRVALVGGLDINERRYDDARHQRHAAQTWHDLSCLIEGAAAADFDRHFVAHWNHHVPDFNRTLERLAGSPLGRERKLPDPPRPVENRPPARPADGGRDGSTVQALKTLSRRRNGPFAIRPHPIQRDFEEAYEQLIPEARRLIYIETQFFRWLPLARRLAARLRSAPDLELLMVIPMAPEDVAFLHDRGAAARHGEWLQSRCLEMVKRAAPERVGIFSLVRHAGAEPDLDEAAKAFGSGIVYVHSKTTLVDDRWAILGSANCNGRSLRMDTELGFLWDDPEGVGRLRRELWKRHFEEAPQEGPFLPLWRRIAEANAASRPTERQGFLVPYRWRRAYRFGRFAAYVPDSYV